MDHDKTDMAVPRKASRPMALQYCHMQSLHTIHVSLTSSDVWLVCGARVWEGDNPLANPHTSA